jgi:hypothetical protein
MLREAKPLPRLICSRPTFIGGVKNELISMATRDELVAVIAERYWRRHGRSEAVSFTSSRRLPGFTASTRCAFFVLVNRLGVRARDDAAREALIVIWEASDRLCGKRLRPLVPVMVEAIERHGDLRLAPAVRISLLAMSAATIGATQKLVEDGVKYTWLFASRHGWAPLLPSCPTPARNS